MIALARTTRIVLFALTTALIFSTVSITYAHAQTSTPQSSKPRTVATVNIYSAKILQQNGGTFSISFDLSNREGAQPGIRYAVQLVDPQQMVADEHIYSDVVSLDSNTTVNKSVDYTPPSYLSGAYRLMLVSRNTNGLILAHASLGEVTLSGTDPYVEILSASCYLEVAGEKGNPQYSLEQGVDIAASETLKLTCPVVNHSSSEQTLNPVFKTFSRNTFGAEVVTNMPAQKPIIIGADKEGTFTVPLPKATVPQAYDVRLSFEGSGTVPSNSVTAHYVLRGGSATIQNLTLDKTSYTAESTAVISLFWTGPASNFFDARATSTTASAVQAIVGVANSAGPCGREVAVALDAQRSMQTIQFPITSTCDSPKVTIRLADQAGSVLAASSFNFQSPPVLPAKPIVDNTLMYVLLALVALVLVYGVRRWFSGRVPPGAALVLAGLCIVSYGLPGSAHADTFAQDVYLVSSGGWAGNFTFTYDVNLNKASYSPGESMTAAGNVTMGNCGNSLTGSFTAIINAQHKDVYRSILVVLGPHNYHVEATISSNTFTAPMSPGTYIAQFFPELHVPNAGPGAGSYFSVAGVDAGGGGNEEGQDGPGASMGKWGGRGGSMMRDWVGTTPYEMPYTVVGCTPTGTRSCFDSTHVIDSCGTPVQTCAAGQICSNGVCSCTPNGTRSCSDLTHVVDSCGNTVLSCPAGQVCSGGACGACTPGSTRSCADSTHVIDNCGNVVQSCSAGQTCSSGVCSACTPTLSCLDLKHASNGCGTITVCGVGKICAGGVCQACTPSDTHSCSDSAHVIDSCGDPVATCSAGQICSHGACISSCSDIFYCEGGSQHHQRTDCTIETPMSCSFGCSDVTGQCMNQPQPDITFDVIPLLVRQNRTVQIEWNSTLMDSCTVASTNGGTPWAGIIGTQTSLPIQSQTFFTIRCLATDTWVIYTKSATVDIIPAFCEPGQTGC